MSTDVCGCELADAWRGQIHASRAYRYAGRAFVGGELRTQVVTDNPPRR